MRPVGFKVVFSAAAEVAEGGCYSGDAWGCEEGGGDARVFERGGDEEGDELREEGIHLWPWHQWGEGEQRSMGCEDGGFDRLVRRDYRHCGTNSG